ncbi:2-oxo acid dehydrogenase subunit E2 [Mycobacterium sp. SMC-18]|uniref:2-oxo acid dehydrogenase subunit E2 n=1 Tax=Mycobacterium sp. SMC-18 TaxID=3381629 RepID=UPI003875E870
MTSTQQDVETVVYMPALGESVEEGTVTRWLKQPGDRIDEEEPLLEVATDKVDTEVPSPCSGILVRLLAEENDVVAVGAELAVISTETAAPPVAAAPQPVIAVPAPAPVVTTAPPIPSVPQDIPQAAPTTVPEPAPVAVSQLPVESAAPNNGTQPVEKLTRIRRTIAARMVESLSVSAQLTTVLEVDLSAVAKLRNAHRSDFHARTGAKLSFLPFFTKAAIAALPEHPMLNASLNADVTEVTYHSSCHLGIAVDSPKGLMVPVIRNADTLSLARIAQSIADLAQKVRSGTITPDELSGGTFTITNTGSRGALFDTPIINQPQTGILGTGAVVERLVPIRDEDSALRIEARPFAYMSITYDHRIVDGADAARYLSAVKKHLESGFAGSDLEE